MTYRERVAPTGASVPLLFVATEGKRQRGVRVLISDVLLWTLKPKPTDEQLPLVGALLGKPHLVAAVASSGVDAFFEATGDVDIPLRTDNSPATWDPGEVPA